MEPTDRSFRDLEAQGIDRSIVHDVTDESRAMFSSIHEGDWPSMLELLRRDGPRWSIVHPVPTAHFKDTIVHAAAALGKTEVVKELLLRIKEMNLEMSLGVLLANQLGNNPLHSAALMGQVETLKVIFEVFPELASARNIYGETPIFQAAISGSKQVFSELASMLPPADTNDIITMLRRNDGDTILHCALSGEYFDLASDIIERFAELIYYRNGRGLTPLHILANNPSGFKSGCQLGLLNRLLYSSIKFSTESTSDEPRQMREENDPRELAGDYRLSRTVTNFWWKTFEALGRRPPLPLPLGRAQSNDTQTSEDLHSAIELFGYSLGSALALIPLIPIMALIFILAFTSLFITALGGFVVVALYFFLIPFASPAVLAEKFSNRRGTIRKLKKKHRRANEVTKKILDNIKQWQDFSEMNSGMDPYRYQLEWTRGAKPGTEQLQGDETVTTLLQRKEIPSAFEANFIQESQQSPTTVSHPCDPSSSSIPARTNSYMSSSTNGASFDRTKEEPKRGVIESPFLIAGKKGVIEMVEEILKSFPMAIHDKDIEHKNIMLLAAEHRQHEIYPKFLNYTFQSWFREVDTEGNSLLHLAAKYPDNQGLLISGAIPGAALQMQREIAWFNFVKKQLPPYFSTLQNHTDQTAMEVFTETHQELAMQRAKWLSKASQSCSVVATLIISVVFATMATVPGGLIQDQHERGLPVYKGLLAFNVFSVSSLSALCFSSISLIMFLNILTSPYQDSDIGNNLANKLILGLGFLFISIMAMFLSFFSGDLFVLDSKMKYIAYPIYVLTSCVVLAGFPLYSEIVKMVVTGIPTSTRQRKFSF